MSPEVSQAMDDLRAKMGALSDLVSEYVFVSKTTGLVHGHALVGVWTVTTPTIVELQRWILNPHSDKGWHNTQTIYFSASDLRLVSAWAATKHDGFALSPPGDRTLTE
jgi:hypothetical protein